MKAYQLKASAIDALRPFVKEEYLTEEVAKLNALAKALTTDTDNVLFQTYWGDAHCKRPGAVYFYADDFDVMEQKEYDPEGWNAYPAVTPPKGELFMVWLTRPGLRAEPRVGKTFSDSDVLHIHAGDCWLPLTALNVVAVAFKRWG